MPEPGETSPDSAAEGRRTTWLLLGGLGLVAVAMLVLAVVAAIPLITSGTRDARPAEGIQLMGAARETFRIGYKRDGNVADAQAALHKQIKAGALDGKYYRVGGAAVLLPDGRWQVTAVPNEAGLKTGTLTFDMESGQSEIAWR